MSLAHQNTTVFSGRAWDAPSFCWEYLYTVGVDTCMIVRYALTKCLHRYGRPPKGVLDSVAVGRWELFRIAIALGEEK